MKKALLIGINYTSVSGNTLHGCINDIVNMSNILVSKFGYDSSNVTMLRDDSTNANMMPTKANMLAQLNAFAVSSSNCSEIWIHYSGHGSQVMDRSHDEASGFDDVIVPVDFKSNGFIIDDDLQTILSNFKCRTFILLDSCYSGTGCDLEWGFEYIGNRFRRTQNNRVSFQNKNVYMYSGCKDTQTSADIYDTTDKQYEGAFTAMFLRALKNNNYNVTLFKLYQDTCTLLAKDRYIQKPILSSSSNNPVYTLTKTVSTPVVRSNTITTPTVAVKSSMKDILLGNIDIEPLQPVKSIIYSYNDIDQIKNNMKNIMLGNL